MSNIHCPKYGLYYDRIIELYKSGKTPSEIVSIINVPDIIRGQQISKILNSLGILPHNSEALKRRLIKYEKVDAEAYKLIKNGMSINAAAKKLNVQASNLSQRLKIRYNFTPSVDGKKLIDSNYFSDINAEEKAYWLGFLFADGYVSKDNGVELTLKSSDISHLEKLKQALHSEHKIIKRKITLDSGTYEAVRFSFKDSQIANDLKMLGCVNAKSLVVQMPDLMSLELYRHFLRGYFDGNGSIISSSRNCTHCQYDSGSYNMIISIIDHAKEIVGVSFHITTKKDSKCYTARLNSRYETIRYLGYLYNQSTIYLDRKYNQYQKSCRLENIPLDSQDYEDGIKRGWRNVK